MSVYFEPVSNQTLLIHVGAYLDFRNAAPFKQTCYKHIDSGTTTIIINFRRTNVLDIAGLRSLLQVYQELSRNDGQVLLAEISSPVRSMLYLTRASKLFLQYDQVSTALEKAGPENGPEVSPSPNNQALSLQFPKHDSAD